MNHRWGCISIYRPLSYPFRFLASSYAPVLVPAVPGLFHNLASQHLITYWDMVTAHEKQLFKASLLKISVFLIYLYEFTKKG